MVVGKTLRTTVFACLVILTPSALLAQGVIDRSYGDVIGNDLNPLQRLTRLSTPGTAVPMEGAVDPEEYVVGPGDMFDVSVTGPVPIVVTLPVSADGYLMLPEAGAVNVAGRSLAEARRLSVAQLREQFQNVRVEVMLSQPRQFYVHVSGAVPVPGRFVATPVARLSTVLNMAFADTIRAAVSNTSFRPALRNVRVIHRDGRERSVDLLRYYSTGDTDQNPYLRDGDVISVPTYDPNYDGVYVQGAVAFPGTYDHRPDDTLFDLLVMTTGQNPPRGFDRVRLTRTLDDGRVEGDVYDRDNLPKGVKVHKRDQISVLPERTVRGTATIEGWVEFPGTYSIEPGRTTVKQLLELSGGLREGALGRGSSLERRILPDPELHSDRHNHFEFVPRPLGIRLVPADSLLILRHTRLSPLDFLSRAYLAQEMRVHRSVPIDLSSALSDDALPVVLQDGDRVVVPRDDNTVLVFGQVNRPGYVPYRAGAGVDYYLASSGGLSEASGQVFVIEAGTLRYQNGRGAEVFSGDVVFVDQRESQPDNAELQRLVFEQRREELDRRSRNVQAIVSSIGAATAIVTTYLLIRRN